MFYDNLLELEILTTVVDSTECSSLFFICNDVEYYREYFSIYLNRNCVEATNLKITDSRLRSAKNFIFNTCYKHNAFAYWEV